MQRLIQSLSPRAELIVVILVAFGWFILGSLSPLLSGNAGTQESYPTSDAALLAIVVYELIVLGLLGAFLHVRGWTLPYLGFEIDRIDLLHAVGLLCVTELATRGALFVGIIFSDDIRNWLIQASHPTGGSVGVIALILVSVVNPIFEELFVCSYVIRALQSRTSMWTAINVSTVIRVLYHLYQGPISLVSIVPFGLICAYWFARTGRLWPLILVHMASDLFALLPYVK